MSNSELDEYRLRRLIDVGAEVVSNLDTDSLLEQIVQEAREITGARYAALGVLNADRDGLERFLTSGIDDDVKAKIGGLPKGLGVLGVLIKDPRPIRLHRVCDHVESFGFPPNHPPMESFLGVPVMIDGAAFGNLYLTDKQGGDFDQADQDSVEMLAYWASIAIANARSVRKEQLHAVINAAESERHRWALELHDETLQGLGALRLLLATAQRSEEPKEMSAAINDALDLLSLEITGLRSLITELRPAALDSLGLEAALETLARRAAGTADYDLQIEFDFNGDTHPGNATEQEIAAYRLVQEALSNAAKHSQAEHLVLGVSCDREKIVIEIVDDGVGFDMSKPRGGFGLTGMQERVALVDGDLRINSKVGEGTRIRASLPIAR